MILYLIITAIVSGIVILTNIIKKKPVALERKGSSVLTKNIMDVLSLFIINFLPFLFCRQKSRLGLISVLVNVFLIRLSMQSGCLFFCFQL
jgi:hypothetical protein